MTEIKKVKTSIEHQWNLTINGTVIGQATAINKTPTQRYWKGSIAVPLADGSTFEHEHTCDMVPGKNSVRALITVFTEQLDGKDINVVAPVVVKKVKSKYPKVLTSKMVTPENALDISEHFKYTVDGRDGTEQAEYIRKLLNVKATEPKVPMADLVEKSKQGETHGSPMTEHYPNE